MELPLTHHELYRQIGIDPPRGVLLYGAPGTGKTMLAKAVAHHTTAAFIRVVGSEFVQKYLGEVGPAGCLCTCWSSWGTAQIPLLCGPSALEPFLSVKVSLGCSLKAPVWHQSCCEAFLLVDHSTLTKQGWPSRDGNHMAYRV